MPEAKPVSSPTPASCASSVPRDARGASALTSGGAVPVFCFTNDGVRCRICPGRRFHDARAEEEHLQSKGHARAVKRLSKKPLTEEQKAKREEKRSRQAEKSKAKRVEKRKAKIAALSEEQIAARKAKAARKKQRRLERKKLEGRAS